DHQLLICDHLSGDYRHDTVNRTVADLEKIWPGVGGRVTGYDLHRFPYAFPVFPPGYRHTLDTLKNDPTVTGDVRLVGDYLSTPTFDGAIYSAMR
ncbi:MAG: hypothetical protein HQK87_12020, partial [Nitrospinae bacterium]|nr:hypothetical protein [Nitrospinota bacterium]